MSLDFWSKMKKIDHTGMVKMFRFGVKNFPMILWFQTIKDGLLKTFHQLRLSKQPILLIYREFFEFGFLVQNEKNLPYRYGQNFQIWGQTISNDFMVLNDTGRTIEDILSVETG